ncbi:MAG: hypothetical protein GX594_10205 [Pirellulaceae bacterium]|nr:hypothetical protein [Pirellulaceae bacterium]
MLDCYGGPTTVFSNNQITRGETPGAARGVYISGRWKLIGNRFHGFDEPDAAAMALFPDRFGNASANLYRNNIFESCGRVVCESRPGLWQAAVAEGNLFIDCKAIPPRGEHALSPADK